MNGDSVKARLKNLVREEGGTFQEKLTTYALERSIYRLSVSPYADRFTLKGGLFLYALFERRFTRVTMDIDLLAQKIPNNVQKMEQVFCDIFSITSDDALHYDLDSLTVRSITEFKEYHGVNVAVNAYLDRTRIPVAIDIGFGDVIIPERVKMSFPSILGMEEAGIYAYSIYSVIAEKFEAITSLGLVNSRYKDFYDIYAIAGKYDLQGIELQKAVQETFRHRNTGYDDIAAFENSFAENYDRQRRWSAFVKKKKALDDISFKEVLKLIRRLMYPIVMAIMKNEIHTAVWNHDRECWEYKPRDIDDKITN